MSEPISLPERRKSTKTKSLRCKESCPSIKNFFKLLEEMETNKISEKSGNHACKGPLGSNIEYTYLIKINPGIEVEETEMPASKKLRTKKETQDKIG